MTLSVCFIAHNEEENLPEALESVRFADEVIVVDCESHDETALIAEAYGARVLPRPNLSNLNINKNYSFDRATGDYILCLDADEIIPAACAREIQGIVRNSQSQHTAYYLPRRNLYLGRWLKYGGHFPDWQLRLFRRGAARFPEKHIHERLQVHGSSGRLHQPFEHHPYRDKEDCQRKLERDTNFEALYLYEQGVRPSLLAAFRFLLWKPGERLFRRYLLKGGFLDGNPGWQAAQMDLQNFRLRYQKLRRIVKEKYRQS